MIIIVRQYSKSKLVWYFVYRLKKKNNKKKTMQMNELYHNRSTVPTWDTGHRNINLMSWRFNICCIQCYGNNTH